MSQEKAGVVKAGPDGKFHCPLCKKGFKQITGLRYHMNPGAKTGDNRPAVCQKDARQKKLPKNFQSRAGVHLVTKKQEGADNLKVLDIALPDAVGTEVEPDEFVSPPSLLFVPNKGESATSLNFPGTVCPHSAEAFSCDSLQHSVVHFYVGGAVSALDWLFCKDGCSDPFDYVLVATAMHVQTSTHPGVEESFKLRSKLEKFARSSLQLWRFGPFGKESGESGLCYRIVLRDRGHFPLVNDLKWVPAIISDERCLGLAVVALHSGELLLLSLLAPDAGQPLFVANPLCMFRPVHNALRLAISPDRPTLLATSDESGRVVLWRISLGIPTAGDAALEAQQKKIHSPRPTRFASSEPPEAFRFIPLQRSWSIFPSLPADSIEWNNQHSRLLAVSHRRGSLETWNDLNFTVPSTKIVSLQETQELAWSPKHTLIVGQDAGLIAAYPSFKTQKQEPKRFMMTSSTTFSTDHAVLSIAVSNRFSPPLSGCAFANGRIMIYSSERYNVKKPSLVMMHGFKNKTLEWTSWKDNGNKNETKAKFVPTGKERDDVAAEKAIGMTLSCSQVVWSPNARSACWIAVGSATGLLTFVRVCSSHDGERSKRPRGEPRGDPESDTESPSPKPPPKKKKRTGKQ